MGLLGGSFDPAHEGHVHITREALKRMGLDQVWWLVTPANPLKARQPAPLADRMARARAVMRDPRVKITALEARLGTRATADTIDRLKAIYPGVTFVWLMGADNLVQFHRWGRWRDILRMVAGGGAGAAWGGRAGAAVGRGAGVPGASGGPGREPARAESAGLGLREPADERCVFDRDPGAGWVDTGALGAAPRAASPSRRCGLPTRSRRRTRRVWSERLFHPDIRRGRRVGRDVGPAGRAVKRNRLGQGGVGVKPQALVAHPTRLGLDRGHQPA